METSPLDFVAQACMDLTDAIKSCNSDAERDELITSHISKVWSASAPVFDFKRNLEWVNVTEPISLAYHCLDKVVVLDFWTYCCINCYHVLPDLAHIEKLHSVEDGLVVIGVHSPKFSNEKLSRNVLAAVQRYGIQHPVVNDSESNTWELYGIHCWPTLVILGPGNKPIFVMTGEGHRQELEWFVGAAIAHFSDRLSTAALPVSVSSRVKGKTESVLKFPGKVSLNPFYKGRSDEPFLAIADTGNHRVLLTDFSGLVIKVIGGEKAGYKEGNMSEALLDSPQGICWLSSGVIAICDTNNHALRTAHLDEGTVETLAGTGKQGLHGDLGGKCLGLQPLSSPWDVALFVTPDMDMSVRPQPPPPPPPPPPTTEAGDKEKDENEAAATAAAGAAAGAEGAGRRQVLLAACAGAHQLWALFLDTTIWWKYKTYKEGTCVCIAGSGAEAARNSAYPNTAAFAQPSGLALRTGNTSEVYIADSESSSIRKLNLSTGQVSTLCGGDRNPLNLFAFGDVDDVGMDAKLQHPLGVAYCEHTKTLYIADTYNNKVKKVDLLTQKVTTLNPTMIESADPAKFAEPSGLSISNDGKYLYIADTNNHAIKVLNVTKNVCHEFRVRLQDPKFVEPENLILYKNDLFVNRKYGNLIIYFNVSLDKSNDSKNVKFTPGAPQTWSISIRDENNKDVTLNDFEFVNCTSKGLKLPGRVQMKLRQRTENTHYKLYLSFQTALCDASVCFSHAFTVRSTMLVRDSVKMVESYKITCKVNPVNRGAEKPSSTSEK